MVGNNKDKKLVKTTRETFGSIDPATSGGQAGIALIIFFGIFILIALVRFLNSDVDR